MIMQTSTYLCINIYLSTYIHICINFIYSSLCSYVYVCINACDLIDIALHYKDLQITLTVRVSIIMNTYATVTDSVLC